MALPPPLPEHLMTRGSDPELLREEVLEVIRRRMKNHPRSLQKAIGPSEVGTPCDRKLAYKMAGVPTLDEVDRRWRATVGVAVHAWLQETFEDDDPGTPDEPIRWVTEARVMVGEIGGEQITGSSDFYDRISATVLDWKIVGPTTLREVKKNGPGQQYRYQGHLYGRGFVNAGLPVDVIMIVFLPSNGNLNAGYFHYEPYDPAIAEAALARANQAAALVKAFGAKAAAIAGTADDHCSSCDWFLPAATDHEEACPGHPVTGTAATQAAPTQPA